jgi:hypothetical protein
MDTVAQEHVSGERQDVVDALESGQFVCADTMLRLDLRGDKGIFWPFISHSPYWDYLIRYKIHSHLTGQYLLPELSLPVQ